MKPRVKITDLAKELGLSVSTVSKALSNRGRMTEKTRNAVLELAKKWGYSPNPFAVSLAQKRSHNIGVILPEFTHHYFSKVLNGIEEVFREKGYHLFISTHDGDMEREIKSVEGLFQMRVDGLITSYAHSTTDFDHYLHLLENDIPVVFVDRMCEELNTSYVISDDFSGCVEAVDYLVKTGCHKIAHVSGPSNLSTTFTRAIGYKEGLKKNKIATDESLIISSEDVGWETMLQDLVVSKEIDAVLCYSDYQAFDVVEALLSLGKKIPEEVSVIGFADEPVASYMTPRLSTVQQPAQSLGRRAAEILWEHLVEKSPTLYAEQFPTQLMLRKTTRLLPGQST